MRNNVAGRWSDAAFRDQLAEGKRRLVYVIGLASPSLAGPCNIPKWAPKFAGESGEACVAKFMRVSEMADRMALLWDFFGTYEGCPPGMAGSGG